MVYIDLSTKYAFLTCCQKGWTVARPRFPPRHRRHQAVPPIIRRAVGEAIQKRNSINYKFKSYRDGKVVNVASIDASMQLSRLWRTPSPAEETRSDLIATTPNQSLIIFTHAMHHQFRSNALLGFQGNSTIYAFAFGLSFFDTNVCLSTAPSLRKKPLLILKEHKGLEFILKLDICVSIAKDIKDNLIIRIIINP
jgi:hypothetical protein